MNPVPNELDMPPRRFEPGDRVVHRKVFALEYGDPAAYYISEDRADCFDFEATVTGFFPSMTWRGDWEWAYYLDQDNADSEFGQRHAYEYELRPTTTGMIVEAYENQLKEAGQPTEGLRPRMPDEITATHIPAR